MTAWPTVTLHDISRPKQWKTIAKADFKDGGYPVYGANGVIGYYDDYNHEAPTVLIGCRGSCGSVHVSAPKSWVTGNAMALDDLDTARVEQRFLVYALRADGLQAAVTGTSQPQITRTSLKHVRIPLPPIEEQRRIASVLDAADELRAKRREALAKLDTLTRAIFIDMFHGGGWPTARLGDVVATTSGGTPSRSRTDFFTGDIPWVKSGEIAQGVVRHTEERISKEAVARSSAKLMPPGTVLLAMYGATVGSVGVLGIEATTNQAVCSLTPTERVTGPYLLGLLRSMKRELVARGAGGAQPNISQTIIRDLRIPVPPTSVQTDYSGRMDALAGQVARVERASEMLDDLLASLQQRAFRGEL